MVKGNSGKKFSFLGQWELKKLHKAQNQRQVEQALLYLGSPKVNPTTDLGTQAVTPKGGGAPRPTAGTNSCMITLKKIDFYFYPKLSSPMFETSAWKRFEVMFAFGHQLAEFEMNFTHLATYLFQFKDCKVL